MRRSAPGGWRMVVLCFLALALAFSARAALGLVMPVWSRDFGWTRGFVAGTGAIGLVVMALVAPIAGAQVDRHGPARVLVAGLGAVGVGCLMVAAMTGRTMFVIAYGGFAAIGFGMVANHIVSTSVARLFAADRGLAIGIATSGSTAGQFVVVPLIAWVMTAIDWRWSYGALGAAALLLAPVIFRLGRIGPVATGDRPAARHGALGSDLAWLVRRPTFHVLFWSFLFCGYATTGLIETHLIPFGAFCGFPPVPSATAYGVLSALNLVGMIGAGWLADRVNRPMLLGGLYLVRAVTFLIVVQANLGYDWLIIFAVLFGLVDYASAPVTASLVASHLGIERMGLAMGLIAAGHAVGGALGAAIGGALFDLTASYGPVWWTGVWISLVAGLMVLPLGDRPRVRAA